MVVDPIGLVGGARGYFVFGKRVCELEAFVGTTGGMGAMGSIGSIGPEGLGVGLGVSIALIELGWLTSWGWLGGG